MCIHVGPAAQRASARAIVPFAYIMITAILSRQQRSMLPPEAFSAEAESSL